MQYGPIVVRVMSLKELEARLRLLAKVWSGELLGVSLRAVYVLVCV